MGDFSIFFHYFKIQGFLGLEFSSLFFSVTVPVKSCWVFSWDRENMQPEQICLFTVAFSYTTWHPLNNTAMGNTSNFCHIFSLF